jgi:hypothetical protein
MRALFPEFVVVCALLVVAGAAKVRSPSAASAVLSGDRLRVSPLAVRALGVGEILIGAGAAIRPIRLTAVLVALAYGAFCAFVLSNRPVRCGCFGDAAYGGPAHAVLNAAACSVAILAAVAPPPGIESMVSRDPVIAVPLAAGIAAGTIAAYLAFTALPGAWRAYGAEGR